MANVLIIRFSALGDVSISVPLVCAIAKKYPDDNFFVVSQPFMEKLFWQCPENVRFIKASIDGNHDGFSGIHRLFRELKALKINVVCDIHGVLRSHLLDLFFLIRGVRVYKIDKGRTDRRRQTRRFCKVLKPLKTSFQQYNTVFNKAGYKVSEAEIISDQTEPGKYLKKVQETYGQKSTKWLGIAPLARHKGKRYPLEKMEKVVAYFSENKDYTVFLFGKGDKEFPVLQEWKLKYSNLVIPDCKGLDEEIKIMNCTDLMLTMDSANMHLGSLANTKVLSIWGATHPYLGFYGFNQDENNVIQLDLPCRPCSTFGNKPCYRKDYACLNFIKPDDIIKKVKSVITS